MLDSVKKDIASYHLADEEITALLPDVRAGNKTAIEQMILAHWSLVCEIASMYAATWSASHLWDDMVSEGILAVTQKVNEIAQHTAMKDHDNVSAFLRVGTHHEIGDWLAQQLNLGSAKTQRKQFQDDGETVKIRHLPCPEGAYFEASVEMIEVRDFIDSIPGTVEEQTIIRMREEGSSYTAIGTLLGMAPSTVHTILQDMHARFSRAEAKLN